MAVLWLLLSISSASVSHCRAKGSSIVSINALLLKICYYGCRYVGKNFIYIQSFFGTCFEERDAILFSQLSTAFGCHLLILFWHIRFVCYEDFGDIRLGMSLYLPHPILHVIESALLRTIVDQKDSHSPFVVGLSNRTESLLTSGVPYLKLHGLVH